jgi:hypothetical protein
MDIANLIAKKTDSLSAEDKQDNKLRCSNNQMTPQSKVQQAMDVRKLVGF